MENNAEMEYTIEEMKREISSLKEQLEEKRREIARQTGPELSHVKEMIEEGLAKVAETVKPVMGEANRKIAEPTVAAVRTLEKSIAAHPFAAILIAAGAGLVIGKVCRLSEQAALAVSQRES